MTKTGLLALAERNEAHAVLHEQHVPQDDEQRQWAADLRAQAALNRKLAALEPVASSYTMEALVPHSGGPKTHISVNRSMPPGTNLFNLTGIIDHE